MPEPSASSASDSSYPSRLAVEAAHFRDCHTVHDLPEIFHYWSNKYIRPKLAAAGFDSMADFFAVPLLQQCDQARGQSLRFVSIGAGNCDMEIGIAQQLIRAGRNNFVIDCLEINETMLQRGRELASEHGVAGHVNPLPGDFNHWQPEGQYHSALAIQSLHHVVNLEGLFDAVKKSLAPGGRFIINDTIGRNGHLRWPEAMVIIQEYWRKLPPSYRYNHQLQRYEEWYQDWDCSTEGFEGVRAQDILPALMERFHFHCFIPYGSLTDPFTERSFGPNFDATNSWDREFIDAVHVRDEQEITNGNITPNHMFAILGNEPAGEPCDLNPARYVRCPKVSPSQNENITLPYEWCSWPHDPAKELELVCARLAATTMQVEALQKDRESLHARVAELAQEVETRTNWARDLDRQLEERTAWTLNLRQELDGRTTDLEALRQERDALESRLAALHGEFDSRTAWALQMQQELEDNEAVMAKLQKDLADHVATAQVLATNLASAQSLISSHGRLGFLPLSIRTLLRRILHPRDSHLA